MPHRYFKSAVVAGRYAARETERLDSEAARQKSARQAAMATLLNQSPVERMRCAAGLVSVTGLDVPGELFGDVQKIWNAIQNLEGKLTKAQSVTTRG